MSRLVIIERGEPNPSPMPRIRGVVYFIQAAPHTYKVGCTVDLERRLATLQRHRNFPLRAVAVIDSDDYTRTEHIVQTHLRKQGLNLTGEWFVIDDASLSRVLTHFKGRWV